MKTFRVYFDQDRKEWWDVQAVMWSFHQFGGHLVFSDERFNLIQAFATGSWHSFREVKE